jgi:hypothetical protein
MFPSLYIMEIVDTRTHTKSTMLVGERASGRMCKRASMSKQACLGDQQRNLKAYSMSHHIILLINFFCHMDIIK